MRLFTRIALLFYMLMVWLLGATAVLFVTNVLQLSQLYDLLEVMYHDHDYRLVIGLISGILVFLSFLITRLIYGSYHQERTIAFDNPTGRVTVSLSALEDMVRRVILRTPDIKEVRTGILATKKALEVEIRLVLKSDMNIPEMTAQLQEMIKGKIQDSIGIEEDVVVRIHVTKISTDEFKSKKNQPEPEERPTPTVPFQGYRA